MKKRKICIVTGTRAEYGLLYWLMKAIKEDSDLTLQLVVTGMHLSPEFGFTYREIEKEFSIDKKTEILLSSDTPVGISKSIGLGMISLSEAFSELQPDIIVLLGDRYEIFAASTAAMVCRIPIAHIHGGEATEGLIDEPIRHSITKMSHLHFTATEQYRKKVIQLGEHPDMVFNVGGLGIENIKRINLLSKPQLEKSIDFKLGDHNILVTFHPVTLEESSAEKQFKELLSAIKELPQIKIIFTKANSDTNGRIINHLIDKYVQSNSDRSVAFTSLGQLRYLSTLQFIDAVVGNSSSGLTEAPSFHIGTINIGDRQRGRIKAHSVIDCRPDKKDILKAFKKLYSRDFQSILETVQNPYDNGIPSQHIVPILKNINLDNILKKTFYNIWSNVKCE